MVLCSADWGGIGQAMRRGSLPAPTLLPMMPFQPAERLCPGQPQSTCASLHRELKEKIQPEILELIKQQRLNRLVEGTCFRKLNCRRRQGIVLGAPPDPAGVSSSLLCGDSQGHGCWCEGRPCSAVLRAGIASQGSCDSLCKPRDSASPG